MTRALQNSLTFDVTFKVYDYTESYGEYINDNVYGVSHNNSIKEILDPTMKQYDAQIVMRDINDGKKNCVLFQFKSLLKNKKMSLIQCQDEMHQLSLEFV